MSKKKTLEEFAHEVFLLENGNYSIADNEIYRDNKTKIKMIHKDCRKYF